MGHWQEWQDRGRLVGRKKLRPDFRTPHNDLILLIAPWEKRADRPQVGAYLEEGETATSVSSPAWRLRL